MGRNGFFGERDRYREVLGRNTVSGKQGMKAVQKFNPLNAELNPIFHLLALLRAHHILHVSGIRVK
jgi:hypothetical protein